MIKFQSYVEQVDITISHPEFGAKYYENIYKLMMSEFSFKDIIELDCLCENRVSIENFWSWFNLKNNIGELFSREIKKFESSLNEVDFVAFLIKYKAELVTLIPKSTIIMNLKDFILDEIDIKVIRKISVIKNHLENGIFNEKDALGVFFVNPKKEAINKYEHYIFRRCSIKTYDLIAQNIEVNLGRLKDIIRVEHIPFINYLNYRNTELLFNTSKEHITFTEIENLIKNFNYFRREYPLALLSDKELLDWEVDVLDEKTFKSIIDSFFQEKLKLVSDKFGTKYSEVFFSSITKNYSIKYNINQLLIVQEELSESLVDKITFQGFVSVLSILNDYGIIKNATARFPKIFMYYIKNISVKEDAIEGYFKRPGKNMKAIYDNMANWVDVKLV